MPDVSIDTAPCSNCGAAPAGGARFCGQCGDPLVESPAAGTGERKQVTILFCDLSGYTELSERLDPEETGALMARIFKQATRIVTGYEGRVEKLMGDAVMAIFGATEAHEDDPIRAVRSALELHAAVDELAVEFEPRIGTRLSMHSGINTGLIVTGELNLAGGSVGVVGDTINVASRLMSQAPSGAIWLGPTTTTLTAKAIETEGVGEVAFKGKSAPLPVSRVTGLVRSERIMRPTRTRFVGREKELGTLLAAVDEARQGRATSFGVLAEAGGGKTRLFEEFRRRLPDDVRWIEGRAYAYTQRIPYFVLVDLWRRAFSIEEDDHPAAVRRKLEAGVGALLGSDSDALPIIGWLFDVRFGDEAIDSTSVKPRLLRATRALLAAWSAEGPSVACVQDLHWADAASAALVAEIMADPGAPIVCVANYRPGFAFDDDRIHHLDLSTLSPAQLHELVGSMVDDEAPAGLDAFVEARSGGNPFFAEEIVTALIETGTLARDGAAWELTGTLDEAGIPSTVQGVLAARIDRLDDDRRRLLREASVIGREFLYDVVNRISETEGPPDAALASLEAADLIREKRRDEDLEYIFKHALTQEVAYEGLLKSERRALHQRVGEAIESLLAHRLGEQVETLAYHFHRAGDLDKAARYAIDAGKRAFERHAIDDAEAHFQSGYELLDGVERTAGQDRLLVELLVEWTDVLTYDLKQREAGQLLERHWPLAERLDDPELTSCFRALMVTPHWTELGFERADVIAEDALARAREHASPRAEQIALTGASIGTSRTSAARGVEMLERAVSVGEQHGYPSYMPRFWLGSSLAATGRFEQLGELLRWMDGQASDGVGRYRAYGASVRAMRAFYLVDPDAAVAQTNLGLSVPHDAVEGSNLFAYRTMALIQLRRYEDAGRSGEEHMAFHRQRPAEYCESIVRSQLAGARAAQGELAEFEGVPRAVAERQHCGDLFIESVLQVMMAETYVRIADQEIVPPLSVLLRNLGFVFRQALPAKANARRCLARGRQLVSDGGYQGLSAWVAFTAARVALLEKRRDEARRELDVCLEIRRAAGFPDPSAHIAHFMKKLDS